MVLDPKRKTVEQRNTVAQDACDFDRRRVVISLVDHESHQPGIQPASDSNILSDSFMRESSRSDFELNTFIRRALGKSREPRFIKNVQWQVVSDLKQLHAELTYLVQQAMFVEPLRRIMA